MKPTSSETDATEPENKNPLAQKFPGLAIPNKKPDAFSSDEDSNDEQKPKRVTSKDIFKGETSLKPSKHDAVDQAMAELEALAPSNAVVKSDTKDIKKRERSPSREKNRKTEESRDRRKRRSRSRDKLNVSKDRRSKSHDEDKRRRSRSRQRNRSRSRDRRRRSRSRGRRSRSRGRRSRSRGRSKSRTRRSRSRGRRSRSRGKRPSSHDREDRHGDYGKKPRRKSPDVEMTDDPEPGKVSQSSKTIFNNILKQRSATLVL